MTPELLTALLLKARKETIEECVEHWGEGKYDIIEKSVDVFIDYLEGYVAYGPPEHVTQVTEYTYAEESNEA